MLLFSKAARLDFSPFLWFVFFLCFAAGIFISSLLSFSFPYLYIFSLFGIFLIFYFSSKKSPVFRDVCFIILFFVLGIIWEGAGSQKHLEG
ncbi:MAG: hypothetical protein GF375_03385, partial [Candidatus Omnitrophica bacterium]|nr:hypothetical protein [Candidatus Omnitrophota bacterium]